jgi:hypothetical protein
MLRILRIGMVLSLLAPQFSWALIVLDSRTSMNNSFNTTAPANGAPWSNVAQQQRMVAGSPIVDSSAVYIGNGFVLTAAHTYGPTSVILDGVAYSVDTSFPAISFSPLDVRLYKIQNPPALPLIPFPDAAESDLNRACTMIGWGKGKGAIVTGFGWQWGDDTTKAKRWGTNTTDTTVQEISYFTYSYNAMFTAFETSGGRFSTGQTEATVTMSDSGGGLFQQFTTGGPWKLSGLLTQASFDSANYPDGNSFYNNSSYKSYAVRLKDFADRLRYRQWKQAKGIAIGAAAGDDADGDGIGLLEEYAFGMDPHARTTAGTPVAGLDGANATLTYQLERTRTDLVVSVQESTDLVEWSPATVASTETVSNNGTVRTYKAKVPMGGATKKFLRLHIAALAN